MKTDTKTLIEALHILANDIQSNDGVANACIAEAAERIQEIDAKLRFAHKRERMIDFFESQIKAIKENKDTLDFEPLAIPFRWSDNRFIECAEFAAYGNSLFECRAEFALMPPHDGLVGIRDLKNYGFAVHLYGKEIGCFQTVEKAKEFAEQKVREILA